MLAIIIKGFIIGILISAPIGPMGMFTIQRTLTKGRWHGFFTGLGIMTSDLLYAFVAMVGVNVFSSLISNKEQVFQFIGSGIIIVLGFFLYRTNPIKEWTPQTKVESSKFHLEYISAFLLAIVNIGVLFIFLTLYAHTQFNPIAEGKGAVLTAMLSILSGALLWWFFMTGMISRLRKHFNRKGLVIMNRLIGSVLMIIGGVGLFSLVLR